MLTDLKLFKLIEDEVNLVTDAQLQAALRKLDPAKDTEKMIGIVERDELRRLWVAAKRFERQAIRAKADGDLATEEETAKLKDERWRNHQLEKITLDLFWYGLKAELGNWAEATENTIGIREDWRVVLSDKDQHPLAAILKRLTGE